MVVPEAARVSAGKPSVEVPRPGPVCYWLTRDSDIGGVLAPVIDVWISRPTRHPTARSAGACWLSESPLQLAAVLPAATARRLLGTAPETDLECVRVERSALLPKNVSL